MALKITNLEIGYKHKNGDISVAKDLNLKVEEGQLICLMGPNGAGKSTLLRTITGLQPALSGSIMISGQEIHNLIPRERAKLLAVVLTESPSNGLMTVRESIALGRYPYTNWRDEKSQKDIEQIESAISTISLEDRQNQPLMELSDGYAQKVSIGRALCQDTPLIVLDEPTVHLDVKNKREVMELLRKLCSQKGKSVLISTHDLGLATTFADKLWLLDEGMISDGLPEDLILQGKIMEVFGRDELKSPVAEKRLEVSLGGSPQIVTLVEQALSRFGIINNAGAELEVLCESRNDGYNFKVERLSVSTSTIEGLISHLLQVD